MIRHGKQASNKEGKKMGGHGKQARILVHVLKEENQHKKWKRKY